MAWSQAYTSRYLSVDPVRRRFRVSRGAFSDPEVFRLEKERILYRSWQYLGHESEIRAPGDFVSRQILDKNLIFVRDRERIVRALLNTCTHRGAMLCREKSGNRKNFTCPYHGWTFRNSGELQTRNADFGYPDNFNDDGLYNLHAVPRLEQRSGFWFVNFDKNAQSLNTFLGDAGDRIDMMAQHSAAGLEVIQGCHEYHIRANYKLMCENSYDGYHLEPTHRSYFEYQKSQMRGLEFRKPGGRCVSLTNGHATVETDVQAGRPIAQWLPVWGLEAKVLIDERKVELVNRVGAERAAAIADNHRLMVIFPNTVMNDQQSIQIRSVLPLAHNEMLVRAWLLGPFDEAPALRKIRLDAALSFLGPGGFATPDDIEMLELCQRGYETGGVEWNDLSKGFRPEENTTRDVDEWNNELQLRAYWTEYDRLMTSEPRA
ncbi:MAG: aromatic ring-hydroxylating oxygenase subunit alpha [Panacagrimonas sp.]